ncbi:MAG: pirin family protein, partial [Acidobacteriaceae bacterium]
EDSMGHQEVLGPNEIQRMSAGTGVVHSEFNASERELVHFLQIWIQPEKKDLKPCYEQIVFAPEEKKGKWKLLAGPHGGKGVAQINQDAQVLVTELASDGRITYKLGAQRHAWIHEIKGDVTVNCANLRNGDAATLSDEEDLTLIGKGPEPSEVLLFDLA